jgi:hypothetical protein
MNADLRRGAILLLVGALALPVAAAAQQPPPPGEDPGSGSAAQVAAWRQRIEKRVRLARSLGLAEALDLDEAGTAKMNATMAPFDLRRKAILDGIRGDLKTLREAARGGPGATAAAVDGAVSRVFDARQASLALDREMFAALTKELPPDKVARLALFFAKFRQRFGMEIPDVPGAWPPGARPQ